VLSIQGTSSSSITSPGTQVKIETLTDGHLLHVAVFGRFLTTSSE
jgi:hypothetical protein